MKAVDAVSIEVHRGEFLAVVGASGSGKSTLLNLLGGLDTPTGGRVEVDHEPLSGYSRRQLARYRGQRVGMVFQSFNLISHYTALRNVELAFFFTDCPRSERRDRALAVLGQLGMTDRLDHRPPDLSGGEQQRVALARALAKQPDILLADEPTGNLDRDNTNAISDLLRQLNEAGLTIVMVTHDLDLARSSAHRVLRMDYGRVLAAEQSNRGGRQ